MLEFVAQAFKLLSVGFEDIFVAFFAAHHAANPEKLGFPANEL